MDGPWSDFQAPPQAAEGEGPWSDFKNATFAERFDAAPNQQAIPPAADFFTSMPSGILRGIANTLSASGRAAQTEMGQPVDVPSGPETAQILEKNVTGPLPVPQGMSGRIGSSIGETLGNPTSYIGPGGLGFKLGTAAAAGTGGQLGEETGIPGGRLAGSVLGAGVAGKLGSSNPEAAFPTYREVKNEATRNYNQALNSGLELSPKSLGNDFAFGAEQRLQAGGFSPDGTVYRRLQTIQSDSQNPNAVSVTAQNLDSLRKFLSRQSREMGADFKPTENAAAAAVTLDHYNNYLENLPQGSVLAGDPAAYINATKLGNQNYAAAQRMRDFDRQVIKAQNAAAGGIATPLGPQIRSKTRQLLDRGQYVDNGELRIRGYTPEEQAQAQRVNDQTWPGWMMGQVGRMSGFPLLHALVAEKTGGASLPFTGTVAAAKALANRSTVKQAGILSNMLASRSPLYQQRVNALPPANNLPLPAALLRGGLLGSQ